MEITKTKIRILENSLNYIEYYEKMFKITKEKKYLHSIAKEIEHLNLLDIALDDRGIDKEARLMKELGDVKSHS